jgi:hypothetical protein
MLVARVPSNMRFGANALSINEARTRRAPRQDAVR